MSFKTHLVEVMRRQIASKSRADHLGNPINDSHWDDDLARDSEHKSECGIDVVAG